MIAGMVHRAEPLPVALPGLHAVRVASEAPYTGVKESFVVARFEAGRSEFWTHGRAWAGAPGSIVVFQPGDVHRDLRREGPVTYQLIGFAAPEVDALRVQSCLAASDPRGAPFQRLHDAVAAGADAFTLECVLAEVVAAMAAMRE